MQYTIRQSRFGLFTSYDANDVPLTTALTEEACDFVTKNIRIPVLTGTFTGTESKLGSAIVTGKL